MNTFEELGVIPEIRQAIEELGFEEGHYRLGSDRYR